jgi:flagellar hook protein FlgE
MGLSTALYNGVSGLSTLSESLNVIGDNLANVNTTGFKSSIALFETVFSQTLVGATGPNNGLLGTNPIQVGLGVKLANIQRNFGQGSLNATGSFSDLAVQGNGFFILSDGTGLAYTRDGSFGLAVDGTLVDPSTGLRVQGYQAVNGVVTPTGAVGDIVVPIGMSIARETANALFSGNFDASGIIGVTGSILNGPALLDSATGLAATAATPLSQLQDGSGNNLGLQAGDTITFSATKGGAEITATYTIAAGDTLGDLADNIESDLGLVAGTVAVAADGSLTITGDVGTGNAISDVILSATDAGGTPLTAFNDVFSPGGGSGFTETAAADGESFILSGLNVYDSLGAAVPLTITFTRTGTNELQYIAESPAGTVVGTGVITYDVNGQFVGVTNDTISIDRSAQGALSPLDVTLDFGATTFLSGDSALALSSQDGFPIGSLEEFFVGGDGVLTGFFSNGQTLVLGQVALATFPNQQGLMAIGNNLFVTSANSGEPNVGQATTGGRGTIVGGFLEGSNVDLSKELTNIIIAQTGFQANARTITAADNLLQEILTLVR